MKKSECISLAEAALLFASELKDQPGYRWTRSAASNRIDWPRIELEKASRIWSAYSPDVPGCVSTGKTRAEAQRNFQEALKFHLEGLREDGIHIEPPNVKARVGNSLAVLSAIRDFNSAHVNPIAVYKARGYDGTPNQALVISSDDLRRLRRFVKAGKAPAISSRNTATTSFTILERVDI